MKILSSFTHPQVVSNLYECVCSAEHKGRYSEEWGKQSSSGAPLTSIVLFFPAMEVNGAPKQRDYNLSSKYVPLCSAEQRNSYRFGTTWGWVNDDRIFIFGCTVSLKNMQNSVFLIIQKLTVVSGFHVSWVHSIGIIVFLLYKLYFLSPYPKPTHCTKKRLKKKKNCMIYIFNFLKNVPTRSKMTGITILLLVLLIHMMARHTHTHTDQPQH